MNIQMAQDMALFKYETHQFKVSESKQRYLKKIPQKEVFLKKNTSQQRDRDAIQL